MWLTTLPVERYPENWSCTEKGRRAFGGQSGLAGLLSIRRPACHLRRINGNGSYLRVGTTATEDTFGSTMHGSGRTMSRTQAKNDRGWQLSNK